MVTAHHHHRHHRDAGRKTGEMINVLLCVPRSRSLNEVPWAPRGAPRMLLLLRGVFNFPQLTTICPKGKALPPLKKNNKKAFRLINLFTLGARTVTPTPQMPLQIILNRISIIYIIYIIYTLTGG